MNTLRAWLADHLRVSIGSLGRLLRDPAGTALTTLVMGLTLALPAALVLVVHNLQAAAGGVAESRAMTLFLDDRLTEASARELSGALASRTGVARTRLTTREQALKDFRARTELGAVLDALNENPLPASIELVPAPALDDAGLEKLADALAATAGITQVRRDQAWSQRLSAALAVISRLAQVLAIGLALAVVIAVGNTIRLEIAARRDEIGVLQLIGAPPGYVRRPFLYAGLWFGLGGGLLAVAAVQAARVALDGPVSHWVALYEGGFALQGLSVTAMLALVGCGVALGWVGAWLAVSRHLGNVEPR